MVGKMIFEKKYLKKYQSSRYITFVWRQRPFLKQTIQCINIYHVGCAMVQLSCDSGMAARKELMNHQSLRCCIPEHDLISTRFKKTRALKRVCRLTGQFSYLLSQRLIQVAPLSVFWLKGITIWSISSASYLV